MTKVSTEANERFEILHKSCVVYLNRLGNGLPSLFVVRSCLDGLNVVSSTLRLLFDIYHDNDRILSAKAMRAWMQTEPGTIIVALESCAVIFFALAANFTADNLPYYSPWIRKIWPHIRGTSKSFKCAYKGIRSVVILIHLLTGKNLHYLITPIGLFLGLGSALNRIGYGILEKSYDDIQNKNELLLLELNEFSTKNTCYSPEVYQRFQTRIVFLDYKMSMMGFLSKIFSSFMDSLYYFGIVCLVPLSPPILMLMTVFTVFFSLSVLSHEC